MMLLIVEYSSFISLYGIRPYIIYDQSVNKYRVDSFESIIHSHFIVLFGLRLSFFAAAAIVDGCRLHYGPVPSATHLE